MGWYAAGGIENMLTIIFRVILSIAHTGYKVATVVKSRWAYVRRLSVKIWRQWQPRHDDSEIREESDILEKSLEEINKLPRHLCLLVGHEDQISFFDLVRILGWCIAVGIPYVSFYDHDGFLKLNENIFKAECEKTRPKLASQIDWGIAGLSGNKRMENGASNGFKRRTRVRMLSNADGKGSIVTLAKNLSRAVNLGLLAMSEINSELLEDKLRLENTPDPDLVLVCGPALSTYGLLPWHTRTTEFFNLTSHRDVSVSDFAFFLKKYSRCEQRFGK